MSNCICGARGIDLDGHMCITSLQAELRGRDERIAEVEKLGRLQWGCAGEHRGNGTPDCPKFMHHHHDERCIPGLRNRLKAAEVENVRLKEQLAAAEKWRAEHGSF